MEVLLEADREGVCGAAVGACGLEMPRGERMTELISGIS